MPSNVDPEGYYRSLLEYISRQEPVTREELEESFKTYEVKRGIPYGKKLKHVKKGSDGLELTESGRLASEGDPKGFMSGLRNFSPYHKYWKRLKSSHEKGRSEWSREELEEWISEDYDRKPNTISSWTTTFARTVAAAEEALVYDEVSGKNNKLIWKNEISQYVEEKEDEERAAEVSFGDEGEVIVEISGESISAKQYHQIRKNPEKVVEAVKKAL